jgi:hypothetical protein
MNLTGVATSMNLHLQGIFLDAKKSFRLQNLAHYVTSRFVSCNEAAELQQAV